MPDELQFRHVMAHFVTGVTVVTSRTPDGRPCGLTANSVASVSPQSAPGAGVRGARGCQPCLRHRGGAFAVSILDRRHEELARRFAAGDRTARFEELAYRTETTGSPVLDDALAWLDCRVRNVYEAGDHSIVVGEVIACDAREGEPLVFYRGEYRRMDR